MSDVIIRNDKLMIQLGPASLRLLKMSTYKLNFISLVSFCIIFKVAYQ